MDVSKSVVTAMTFTIDNEHLIKWMSLKNYVKRLFRMFLTEDEVLMGYKDTDKNINAVRISISLAICLKFSFKLVTFSNGYERKRKWMFFLNTVHRGQMDIKKA